MVTTSQFKVAIMMVLPIRLKMQKGLANQHLYAWLLQIKNGMYYIRQSKVKVEKPSSPLVCILMLFNNLLRLFFCTIQFTFTNTCSRSTTITIWKSYCTKSTSITNNSSFLDKDRRENKVNNITFVKSFQIIISNRICYLCLLYPIRLIISLCKTYLLP